ncbi:MAG: adenine-specific methyltransferase EcoRI family protein, partial [Desulfovibrio sp.]|nr:adenine-specific methyltransferase EcoRI family protein [Desulfovibrio sp.]
YTGSPISNKQFSLYDVPGASRSVRNGGKPYVVEVTTVRDIDGDGRVDVEDMAGQFKNGENSSRELRDDGDFRSKESVAYLKLADIVVTNPPFSLFREYVAQLMEYGKKFAIIGNINAITYKEFFPYILLDQVWIGPNIHSGDRKFNAPNDYPLKAAGCEVDADGKKFIKVKAFAGLLIWT